MAVSVESGTWQLDPSASSVALKHKTMWGMVTVKGAFTKFSGQGEVRGDGTVRGTVTLDAASLDTKNAKRDKHLRSADFFDSDKYPAITFTVEGAELKADGTARVSGRLAVRGISRPHSFTARVSSVGRDGVIVETQLLVDRNQFEMGWNQMGMLRGLTTVNAVLRFARTTAS